MVAIQCVLPWALSSTQAPHATPSIVDMTLWARCMCCKRDGGRDPYRVLRVLLPRFASGAHTAQVSGDI